MFELALFLTGATCGAATVTAGLAWRVVADAQRTPRKDAAR